jgi:cobalamin-dependent methionine synthase I
MKSSTANQLAVLTRHEVAVHTLNTVLFPAMKEVGDKFGAGELILPFVLQSAETMKKTVSHLENYLEKVEGVTKGPLSSPPSMVMCMTSVKIWSKPFSPTTATP